MLYVQRGSGLIGSQLIEIIKWIDETENTVVHKFEDSDREIKNGARLVVRETQVAIFLDEGRLAEGQYGDVFHAGTHTLITENIPVLSSLRGWAHGFESPFKADIYFVSTKQFLGFRWGTSAPVFMRDADLGVVRLRVHGSFSFKVTDAVRFFKEVAGTASTVTTESVNDYLRGVGVSVFTNTLATAQIPAIDLAMRYADLSRRTLDTAQEHFNAIGLTLTAFTVESITLPEEVEKHVDKLGSMNVIGDIDRYAKFQTAEAIPAAVSASGGIAGLGAQFAIGQQIAKGVTEMGSEKTTKTAAKYCAKCGAELPADVLYCVKCGVKQ
ncbi:antifreeze protein, type I [Clostridia bacterium]|nr:antifreeze protein, type I [Clostridia bacterium]